MASQQVKINLLFDAQTAQAQKNIQSLGNLLHQISSKTTIGVDSGSLSQAVNAAQQLQIHLQNAVNVDTGKLDLMKLNQELKSSGKTLQDYASSLTAIGPTGEQAFLRLAQAVSHAEVPVVKTNKVIKDFLQTLANTAKWQIASQAIHGIEGMLNNAVGHAKDLNKALTDIQIVTNYSTNYMNNFAQAASKAAKELNTTTTEYAKASLIFYQQGLSGSAVEERASVVVKLSQVTGDSAQKVSDQMTAIWNNFDDGSKSLEYYADALTKLGAATAASTSEISNGLEKFAAVAETVGLSYEYAAASVATVVDKTRQSADIVGTSFKTIFARMQGLSLGETLEDGVDLNKYSAALEKVGVDVLNADGQLRDMDQILDDLGEKWQGLGEETQIALAQTVGGVRQYNQMMALMNNWEDVHKNIDLASKSTGELATQQKNWSASYEASVQKLEQAKNELYENFIDDDLLIGFNDILTQVVSGIDHLIDRIGGVGPAAMILVGLFSKTLFPLIGNGIKQVGNTISVWSGKAAKDVAKMQDSMSEQISAQVAKGNLTEGMEQQMLLSQKILKEKQKLILNSKSMTESERAEAEAKLALAEAMAAETAQILAQKDALEKQTKRDESAVLGDKNIATNFITNQFEKQRNEAPLKEGETQEQREVDTERVISAAKTSSATDIYTQQKALKNANAKIDSDTQQEVAKKDEEIEAAKADITTLEESNIGDSEEAMTLARKKLDDLELEKKQIIAKADIEKKSNEEAIANLQEILDLKRQINQAITNPEETKKAVVGSVKIDKAGEGSSIRLHEEDAATEEFKTQASAENTQMENVMSSFGESVQTDDQGNMNIDASIANYEKLYEAIGKQKSLQAELAASTFDVKSVFDGLTKSSGEVTQATEEAADILKTLSKNDKQAAKAMSDRLKTVKKGSKEYKKLSSDEQKYVDALDKQSKAEAKQEKARDKSVKQLKNSKQAYLELAQKAGLTGEELTNLGKEFDSLGKDSKTNEAAIGRIKQTFGSLGAASIAVEQDLRTVASGMQKNLSDASDGGGEAIQTLTTDLEEMANATPVVDSAMQTTQLAIDGVGAGAANFTAKLSSGIATMTTVAAQAVAMHTAMEGVANAFAEGGTAGEKFQAILGLIMTTLPLVTTLTEIYTAMKEKETLASLKGIAVKIKEFVTGQLFTAGLWAQVGAQLASLLSNPFTMALGLIAIAAIAGVIIMVNRQTKATNENTEANKALTESQREQASASQEQAKETAKTIDAWAEQMHVMDGLIAKYKELKNAQEDSADAAKDIIDAVPDMIEAYNGLAEKLDFNDEEKGQYDDLIAKLERAAESGDVNAVEELTYQIDKMMAGKSKGSLDTGITATKSGLVSDIFTEAGVVAVSVDKTDNKDVLGGSSGVFIEDLDEDSIIKGMSDDYGLTKTWSGGKEKTEDGKVKNGWLGFGLRTDTEENFIEDYEKMQQLYKEAQQKYDAAQLADDKGFQAIKKILEATEGTYNDYKGMIDTRLQANIADASLTLGDANDIENYADYTEHRNTVAEQVKAANPEMSPEQIEEAVNKYFAENGATSNYAKMDNRLITLGEAGANVDEIRSYLEGLSSEKQKLFLNIDINKYQTKEAIEYAITTAQLEADKKKIEVRLEGVNNILGALKEEMTAADWQNIATEWETLQKSFAEVDLSGLMDFQDFLGMSFKEQSEYLEKIKLQQQELLVANAQMKVAQAKKESGILEQQSNTQIGEKQGEINIIKEQIKVQKQNSEDYLRMMQETNDPTTLHGLGNAYGSSQRAIAELEAELAEKEAEKAALENEATENQKQAQENLTRAQQELAIQMQALEDMEFEAKGLNADEVREYASHLNDVAHESELVSEELIGNEKAAKAVSAAVIRMNKGVEALSEGLEEWSDVLTKSDEASQEYAVALNDLRDAMSDLLNVDGKFLSKDFLTRPENLALMEEAAKGSAEAIDELAKRASTDIVVQASMKKGLTPDEVASVTSKFEAMQDLLDGQDLKVGATAEIDTEAFNGTLSELINATGMSVEEMQAAFNALGYEPVFETHSEPYTEHVPITETRRTNIKYEDPNNPNTPTSWQEQTFTIGSEPVTYEKQVPTLSADGTPKVKSIIRTGSGAMNNSSGANKGGNSGGGGSPKKLEKTKKSEMVDRYKELNDQLDTTRRQLEKVNREAEALWGPARLKKMQEAAALMKQENKLLQQKAALAKDYLENGSETDKDALIDEINKNVKGQSFKKEDLFDGEGNFVGYNEVTDALWKDVENAQNAVKDPNNISEAEQERIDEAKERLQNVLDALGIYDETRQTALDTIAEQEQKDLEIQQANLDELTARMELHIEVNQSDLAKIDYYLSKLSDDIYDMSERFTLMLGSLNEEGKFDSSGSQLNEYLENLGIYQEKYNELVQKYTMIDPETGKTYINQAQFMEQMAALQGEIYSELGNIQALDEAMKTGYSDAIAGAQEELSKYTAQMEHHNSVLDHYMTLMDLLGQSKNYDALIEIAQAQAEVAKNTANVSKATYESMQTQADDWYKRMIEAGITEDMLYAPDDQLTEEQLQIRDSWEAAVQAAQEAQDQMLSDAASWAEALKTLLEKELAELADILNESLSGEFGSLDQMNLAMERKNSLQEEYLTKTNKVYETDKMIRTAQQEIDKTSNSAAKRRLKSFIEETTELQNQNKLSEHELQIQQAKYDLTLAEIALEEAQNAKSTVRLQRDAEGNFGYVYTADSSKVAEAEQKLADAQNSLYNIGLEGANNYAQKYAETIQEMNDEITALTEAWMNGDIATEEDYLKQKEDLINHYYAKLGDYSHLYGVSLEADMRVEADAWSTQFAGMTGDTEKWMSYVSQYADDVVEKFKNYNTEIDKIQGYTIGEDATVAATESQKIVDANKDIAEAITGDGGVLDAMEKQLDGISDIILSYINMRDAIMEAVKAAEDLAEATNAATHQQSTTSGDGEGGDEEQPTEPKLYARVGIKAGVKLYNNKTGDEIVDDAPAEATIGNILPGSHGYYVIGDNGASGWIKRDDIDSFDTGGYTGAWGSYGKMAMLHEKELILNKADTANFLASMEVLERILQILDLQAFSSQIGGVLTTPGFKDVEHSTMQQLVEIHADFPNATDRFEIEAAFKSMADLASQYTNQK